MVTDYFVAGNEIADHTITHVGQPSIAEVRKFCLRNDPRLDRIDKGTFDRYQVI